MSDLRGIGGGVGSPGGKLLLMGSSAFKADELPAVVKERIDDAMARDMTIIVGEAHGACRRFQDYLESNDYTNVIVGHARSIRYNAGSWRIVQRWKRSSPIRTLPVL